MRRLFWLLLGAGIAVLLSRKLARVGDEPPAPSVATRVAARLSELGASLATFVAEARSAMAEREDQLRLEAGMPSRSEAGHPAAVHSAAAQS